MLGAGELNPIPQVAKYILAQERHKENNKAREVSNNGHHTYIYGNVMDRYGKISISESGV